jgi:hypothetical protein
MGNNVSVFVEGLADPLDHATKKNVWCATLGGQVDANRTAPKVMLELSRRIFSTSLIILSGQGIYVILGMSWIKMHKAILDIAARLVHLNSLMHEKITLHLRVISHLNASLHHMVEKKVEEIHVVWEFPDMFPDDLLVMPPERNIEFKIELQPTIAPISKSMYQMMPMELAELRIQSKNVLDKGYIHPS